MESLTGNTPILSVRGLTVQFGDNVVLQDVSFEVRGGEVVSIIGPSGAGKSTLLRCINGLQPFRQGTIRVDDIEFHGGRRLSREEQHRMNLIRRRVGMVFQHFNLFPHMTVLQNVMEAPVHVLNRRHDEVEEQARELLQRVGLTGYEDAFPASLSGGQKQRVAIVRALAMNPEIMLFDEVTSALDPELVGEVLGVMTDLAEQGMTMLVVTHEMGFARKVSSRVLFMAEGGIVESAESEVFFSNPDTDRARTFIEQVLH
ncbi:MAG: amino acid ABC transporter ATP-binding protein [Armatimonadota bacterium]